ncbi:MAG: chemotaxis protein CheC [Lachnospiraceae bacterium]
MGVVDLNNLSDMQYDVLKELGNIGAGNATTALSQMLSIRMDMSVPNVALLDFCDISSFVGPEDAPVVGILLGLGGDITGMMMFLFDINSARHLVNKLMMDEKNMSYEFNEIELSALNEIGNIVGGSYLTALATLTQMRIEPSVPCMTIDMLGALLDVPAAEYARYGDKILIIQSKFGESDISGYFLLIPELESYAKILSCFGMC